uniref:Bis(5'-adenosyl)-triphosphatase n=1 Tax=Rhodosorus marinus TaxID=101924 RepID=A0A7S3E9F9_9RHOD|mmetsp:Transcript_16463/g.67761  ORF Transcript_16463/g.67761 Transcript_16463/m.67761 type:complete len:155 (+) Transcript_16463:117-581(+)
MAYKFGTWGIDASEVFVETNLSYAFVNYKPVVEGHVLVASKRVVPRCTDLSAEEIRDLWTLAHRVGPGLESLHSAESLTYVVQDGVYAGQTVPHVHIHIMPRKPNDFQPNDVIYERIEGEDHASRKVDVEKERQPRTAEDMAREAAILRKLFEL